MEITQICIICVALAGLVKGEDALPNDFLTATFGGSVTIPTIFTPEEEQFLTIDWTLNGTIIIFYNDGLKPEQGYEDRANISLSTGALELENLTFNDSGQYRVVMTLKGKPFREGTTTLNVYVPVSGVMVSKPAGDVVETNTTVRLSCSVSSGSSLSFLWLNGSSEVTVSDRVNIADGGSTLIIIATRYDRGPFRCRVSNPISNGTSDPLTLTISYGPENTSVQPTTQYYETGSDVVLTCSAVSEPPAQFFWFMNEDRLSQTGPLLGLSNVQENTNGNYSCQTFNQKTQRYDTSQRQTVTILERISNVSLVPSSATAIEGRSLNLTCDAASGAVFSRAWSKDGVSLDNGTLGRVLSFASLRRSDDGNYTCEVSNPISSGLATYALSVSYGPENVQISGPGQIQVGESLALKCSSESNPSASYTWTLREAQLGNSTELSFVVQNISDSGNYTCHAANSVTGRTSSAVHEVSVIEKLLDHAPPACSPSCIAGISVGCVVLVGAIIGGAIFYTMKVKKKRKSNAAAVTGCGGQENTAYSGSQDLTYASFRKLPQSNDGVSRQLELQESTEYAQIREMNRSPSSPPPSYEAHMQRQQHTTER